MRLRPFLPAAVLILMGLAPPGGSAAEGRYVVVRKDETTTVLKSPPERKGDVYLGRLLAGGQLVSFPAAEVDEERTAAANRPAPTPTPAGDSHVLKRSATRAERKASLKVSRDAAERSLAASSGTAQAESPAPPEDPPASRAGPRSNAGPLDSNGHGEAWWRRKAAPVNAKVARAEAGVERAKAKRDEQERSPGRGTPAWTMKQSRLNDAVVRAQAALDDARRNLDRLSEEARKAGAYPGWLR